MIAPPPPQVAALRCAALQGQDRAPGPAKIVRIRRRYGLTQFVGCVMPAGRVFALTPALGTFARERQEGTGTGAAAAIAEVAGSFAAVAYGYRSVTTADITEMDDETVVDLRSGTGYVFFQDGFGGVSAGHHDYDLGEPHVERLDDRGRLAVAYVRYRPTGQGVTIAAFEDDGTRHVLDQGRIGAVRTSTLTLRGGTVRWISDGRPRRFVIPR